MKQEEAALRIRAFFPFFTAYREKKQQTSRQAISTSPVAQLLQALDLRFQCMRAVAAAKLPIGKPIRDSEQVLRVIERAQGLASEKGITNLEAVKNLLLQNITLAENIQSPYYNVIWSTSHELDGARDHGRLVNNAYSQLRQLVLEHALPIVCKHEEITFSSGDVLGLARDIIQHATGMMIDALVNPDLCEYYGNAHEDIKGVVKQMLSNYMTPRALSDSESSIEQLVDSMKGCSMRV